MVDFVLKVLRKFTKISPKVANFFCPKNTECPETYEKQFSDFFSFDEILSFWDLADFGEPDSETLTSDTR